MSLEPGTRLGPCTVTVPFGNRGRLGVGPTALLSVLLVAGVAAQTMQAQQGQRTLGRGEAEGRRIALVVGNDAYRQAPLRNAVNDARAMSGILEDLGFDVERVENGTHQELSAAVTQVAERLRPADVVLFYFAGHGVQVEGENYLVPVDFQGNSESATRLGSLRVSDVQRELADAQVAMLVLDACRNNPFAGMRAVGGGLALMEARGTLIAFATGAGQTASDNPGGGQGLFTRELLAALQEPGLTVTEVFRRVRRGVYTASNGEQFPAVYDGLLGDVVLRPAAPAASTAGGTDQGGNAVGSPPADASDVPTPSDDGTVRASAEQGDADAQYSLGVMYRDGYGAPQDDAEAARWLRRAAAQGHASAQSDLGRLYGEGRGVPKDDAEALRWYRLAADQGVAVAQYNLGVKYANGEGVPENDAEAVKWYRLAADQGDAFAQHNLGAAYTNGSGVPKNDVEAAKWYRSAADQGHARAQYYLGAAYANGRGVSRDDVLAYMWLDLAAAGTFEERATAHKFRAEMAGRMTEAQLAEAQRLAREWTATPER